VRAILAIVAVLASGAASAADKCTFNDGLDGGAILAVARIPILKCSASGDGVHDLCITVYDVPLPPPPTWTCVRDDGTSYQWEHPGPALNVNVLANEVHR